MIFIDGSNFYFSLKSFNNMEINVKKVNFLKLGKKLCVENRKSIRIYYYNAPLNKQEYNEKYIKQQRFFEKLRKTPELNLVLCRLQKRWLNKNKTKYEYAIKGDDIHIAVDTVKLAYNDAYDTAILVSGDGDFAPAIEAVQEKGKRAEQAYFKKGPFWHLKQKCNESIFIDENFTKNCFDNVQ